MLNIMNIYLYIYKIYILMVGDISYRCFPIDAFPWTIVSIEHNTVFI